MNGHDTTQILFHLEYDHACVRESTHERVRTQATNPHTFPRRIFGSCASRKYYATDTFIHNTHWAFSRALFICLHAYKLPLATCASKFIIRLCSRACVYRLAACLLAYFRRCHRHTRAYLTQLFILETCAPDHHHHKRAPSLSLLCLWCYMYVPTHIITHT